MIKHSHTPVSGDKPRVTVIIDIVAERPNLTLTTSPLGETASGILVVKEDRGAIRYNSAHARGGSDYEIAHYLLHARRDAEEFLFIDLKVISRRDNNLSAGTMLSTL